ncbi:hypothetical protein SDC9_175585 [bioreactor metagenome]|uniref:Uncharacterized protein n=1 Tax=bioreactor metagenome TaxID=1076179 RepID=A0A645GPN3_9ZZZZ
MLTQLLLHVHGNIDRDRERQTHEPPSAAIDLRVDPDDLAFQVEQRPAGVTRIDRDIGLDEGHEIFVGQAAILCADNACGDRLLEAKGRADRQHPLPYLQTRRITQPHDRQTRRVNTKQGHIAACVRADDLCSILALVR